MFLRVFIVLSLMFTSRFNFLYDKRYDARPLLLCYVYDATEHTGCLTEIVPVCVAAVKEL